MAKKQNVFKHNKDIALKLSVDLNARKEAFDSQCTGSGKTYVMKELVKLRSWKKFIVLGPSREVLERTKRTIGLKYTQAEYMTYQKLIRLTTMPGNLDAIIFDEAHRMGAPVWGAACDALRTSNPDAEVVGFTGTRVRGDKVDIAQAKFSGIVSAELTYQDAYHLGILKQPILVSAYFKAPNPIPSIISQLQKLGFDEPTVKMEATNIAKKLELDWNNINIEEAKIIKNHLRNDAQKIIVFFDNISDLIGFQTEVETWFRSAGFNPTMIPYHSKLSRTNRKHNFNLITSPCNPGELKVICAVNILNEGLHIQDIEAVMFLRRTTSPVVYLQQIGRCLHLNQTVTPIVFDFVGNDRSVDYKVAGFLGIQKQLGNSTTGQGNSGGSGRMSTQLEIYEYTNSPAELQRLYDMMDYLQNPERKLNKAREYVESGDIEGYMKEDRRFKDFVYYHGSGKVSCIQFPECVTLFKMYKEWINNPKNYVPVTIQLANQTGDYSGLTESDKNWLNKHTGKRKGYTTYPIAEKTLEKYLRWKELRKVKVPKELWEAHLSGDFSKVVGNINIRHWISRHSRDNSDCRIYPIAVQLKKELKDWKIKNKKK
jgi:hypothetical protein